MSEIKLRAVREHRKLNDLIIELLRRGMAMPETSARRRVQLPLVHSTHPAAPGEEMTPARIKQILLDQEAQWHTR
jgi:hypothetical protein